MEEFEELKQRILNEIENRKLPKEIEKEISKLYDEISQVYRFYNVNNEYIDTYIQGEFDKVGVIIQELNDNRNFKQLEDINMALNNVQRKLENNEDLEENNKKELMEIEMHRNEIVGNISDFLNGSLKSIQLTSNFTLEKLNCQYSTIEKVDDEIREIINKIPKYEEDILEILDEEDKELKYYIEKQYDEYKKYMESKEMTKHKQFAKSLDAGILEEQQRDFNIYTLNKYKEIKEPIQDEVRDK